MMVAVGVLGLIKLASAQESLQSMYVNNLQATGWLGQVDADFQKTRYAVVSAALITDTAKRTTAVSAIPKTDAAVDANWKKYTSTESVPGRQKLVDAFNADISQYRSVRDGKLLPLLEAGRTKDFLALRDAAFAPLAVRVAADLDGLGGLEVKAAAQDVANSQAAYEAARMLIIAIIIIGYLLAVGVALSVGRMIAKPLQQTVGVLEGLAEGKLDLHLDVDSKDEVGRMAVALNTAMAKLRETMSAMGNNAQGLASASEELASVSSQMTGSAEESATQANLVSAAAEQVSLNIQTVATGTEEMSASIQEIAKSAHDAAGVAAQAVEVVETTTATVAQLGLSSAEIGNVIKVINSIAEQTNLLALNATIEAARAGEAGKGFAVVANEVKELAQETSKATEDIGRRIEAIQSDTVAAVTAITQISGIIAQINDTQSTIASAVEEQTATTNEMGRNVTEAATGSSDIAQNITGVARSASDTTAAASSTSQAADELARMASDLQKLVGQFAY